ncbi:MAG: DUF2442 domain-containing protein [Burkholderiales bacterium]|nr:DUF2442 domain-containing protein [Burkholderiales bacterium]MCW5603961.1 DUF2442 domain-containing protein [Burkholderiales bacterium]
MALSLKFRRYRSRRLNLHTVTELRAEDNCTLWLRFDDGLEGHVYLGDLVGGTALEVLSDAALFRRVAFDPVSNVLTWSGGIRVDPDLLYRDLVNKAGAALH